MGAAEKEQKETAWRKKYKLPTLYLQFSTLVDLVQQGQNDFSGLGYKFVLFHAKLMVQLPQIKPHLGICAYLLFLSQKLQNQWGNGKYGSLQSLSAYQHLSSKLLMTE